MSLMFSNFPNAKAIQLLMKRSSSLIKGNKASKLCSPPILIKSLTAALLVFQFEEFKKDLTSLMYD